MNSGRAKTIVLASVGASAVIASLEDIAKGSKPDLRIFIGAGVAGFLLLVAAEFSPALAAAFAALLLVGSLLRNGTAAAKSLSQSLA